MSFTLKVVNRLGALPTRHILVCEDDTDQQCAFVGHLSKLFGPQSDVQVSAVPGGLVAAALLASVPLMFLPRILVLDHDMPWGDGSELLKWLRDDAPALRPKLIIGASGIRLNNEHLRHLGADVALTKAEFQAGYADDIIREVLYPGTPQEAAS